MRKVDAFTHFTFPSFVEALEQASGLPHEFSRLFATTKTLIDGDARRAMMDELGVEQHVLVPLPEIGLSPGLLGHPEVAARLARLCNVEMSALVRRHPDRFIGVAMLPQSNGDTLATELDFAVRELGLAGGVLGPGPTLLPADSPQLEALWAKAVELDVPVWLHPARSQTFPEYVGESQSKYQFFQVYSWLLDTTLAMHRIVFSGVFERHPRLKLVAHHAGALVPLYCGRVDIGMRFFEANAGVDYDAKVKPPYEPHYAKFFIDTATQAFNPRVLQQAVDFFGPSQVLFGSDAPMDAHGGREMARNADASVAELQVSAAQREAIYSGNVQRLLRRS
jgi:predicted TIM-barrel fold metal-dependent hydrolase